MMWTLEDQEGPVVDLIQARQVPSFARMIMTVQPLVAVVKEDSEMEI
jgi:hypothetical protein